MDGLDLTFGFTQSLAPLCHQHVDHPIHDDDGWEPIIHSDTSGVREDDEDVWDVESPFALSLNLSPLAEPVTPSSSSTTASRRSLNGALSFPSLPSELLGSQPLATPPSSSSMPAPAHQPATQPVASQHAAANHLHTVDDEHKAPVNVSQPTVPILTSTPPSPQYMPPPARPVARTSSIVSNSVSSALQSMPPLEPDSRDANNGFEMSLGLELELDIEEEAQASNNSPQSSSPWGRRRSQSQSQSSSASSSSSRSRQSQSSQRSIPLSNHDTELDSSHMSPPPLPSRLSRAASLLQSQGTQHYTASQVLGWDESQVFDDDRHLVQHAPLQATARRSSPNRAAAPAAAMIRASSHDNNASTITRSSNIYSNPIEVSIDFCATPLDDSPSKESQPTTVREAADSSEAQPSRAVTVDNSTFASQMELDIPSVSLSMSPSEPSPPLPPLIALAAPAEPVSHREEVVPLRSLPSAVSGQRTPVKLPPVTLSKPVASQPPTTVKQCARRKRRRHQSSSPAIVIDDIVRRSPRFSRSVTRNRASTDSPLSLDISAPKRAQVLEQKRLIEQANTRQQQRSQSKARQERSAKRMRADVEVYVDDESHDHDSRTQARTHNTAYSASEDSDFEPRQFQRMRRLTPKKPIAARKQTSSVSDHSQSQSSAPPSAPVRTTSRQSKMHEFLDSVATPRRSSLNEITNAKKGSEWKKKRRRVAVRTTSAAVPATPSSHVIEIDDDDGDG